MNGTRIEGQIRPTISSLFLSYVVTLLFLVCLFPLLLLVLLTTSFQTSPSPLFSALLTYFYCCYSYLLVLYTTKICNCHHFMDVLFYLTSYIFFFLHSMHIVHIISLNRSEVFFFFFIPINFHRSVIHPISSELICSGLILLIEKIK